jgi:hypothetical protein
MKCFSHEVAGLHELATHLPSQGSEWSLAVIENASSRSETKMKSSFSRKLAGETEDRSYPFQSGKLP